MKNTVTELKNILEGFNSSTDKPKKSLVILKTGNWNSSRVAKRTTTKKRIWKSEDSLRDFGTTPNGKPLHYMRPKRGRERKRVRKLM